MSQRGGTSRVDFVARAPRYSIQLAMRYRASGAVTWRNGKTENVSRSGILFRGDQLLNLFVALEMTLALPAEIAGEPAASVFCRGRIVRAIPPQLRGGQPALAATIEEFGFVRGKAEDS